MFIWFVNHKISVFVDFPLTPEVGYPSRLSCHPDYISIQMLDVINGPDCVFMVGNCLTCFVFILCLSKPEDTFQNNVCFCKEMKPLSHFSTQPSQYQGTPA